MTQTEYLQIIETVNSTGKYRPDWESLAGHKTPDWYRRGKFGIFIHWGVYSVPAFGSEWYSRNMYDPCRREFEHHRRNWGDQKEFGYKDFIPLFRGEYFDPRDWLSLFRQAGARFILPVAEHHDGFSMYATDLNRWNSVDMGPGRDVMGQLRAACEEAGLHFCVSTHRAENYFFYNMGRTFDSDVNDDNYRDLYGPAFHDSALERDTLDATTSNIYAVGATEEWMEQWMVRTCELIDRCRPKVLYFDWWIQNRCFRPWLKKITAYYYNRAEEWGEEVTITHKHNALPPTVGTFDVERGALTDISPRTWQTDTAIGRNSWGYTRDNEFKSSRQLICDLIDIVSKNGVMLLNVGPRADGTITQEERAVLLDMGKWLAVNGEGIYDTTFWQVFGEGKVNAREGFFMDGEEKPFTHEDFRFTYKGGSIYAFQMRPSGKTVRIRTLRRKDRNDFPVTRVTCLSGGVAGWERTEEALVIRLEKLPENDLPICFKIEM